MTATPPARGRAHTRAHSVSGLGAFSPASDLGCSRAHLASVLPLPAVPARVPRHVLGPPRGVSPWWTPSLCHLRPGSPVRHSPDTARRTLRRRVRLFTPLPPPLPSPRLHTWTHRTERPPPACAVLPQPWATKCAWEHHCARLSGSGPSSEPLGTGSKLRPKPQLTRAWVSRDPPRLRPTLSARSSPRVPAPCADLSS